MCFMNYVILAINIHEYDITTSWMEGYKILYIYIYIYKQMDGRKEG